ncbi:SpoIIE family protein phosphatase [bacterium]|nr:SpoIIE family protein phosphatase [bacterium]
MSGTCFMDVDHYQIHKHGQTVAGDVFLSRKLHGEDGLIAVLSDGMGSGVKANVLATLTAVMSANFIAHQWEPEQVARRIMATLPVCSVRGIAYATFTIALIHGNGQAQIIEFGNPAFFLLRNDKRINLPSQLISIPVEGARTETLRATTFTWQQDDRIAIFSDGITQSGMGTDAHPLGWGVTPVIDFMQAAIENDVEISARKLSRRLCRKALDLDEFKAKDDITCGVIYFREPRKLIVVTGPPVDMENDRRLARRVAEFDGRKVVCGGTTVSIIARELNIHAYVDLDHLTDDVPPITRLETIDLATEGIITLATTVRHLESGHMPAANAHHAVSELCRLLMDSDIIKFLVGTRINEVHQDPAMPEDLEIRRNIIKKMAALLEKRYLKATQIQYI